MYKWISEASAISEVSSLRAMQSILSQVARRGLSTLPAERLAAEARLNFPVKSDPMRRIL